MFVSLFCMLIFVRIVCVSTASVPMIRQQDPMFVDIDGVASLLYEVPEYEEPELIEHQLEQSFGGMPVFSLLEVAEKQANFKEEVPQREKLQATKKAVDDIISKLQDMKSKLEKGVENVYPDIQKTIQNLKHLERSYRPDVRQLLRTAMSIANPLMMPVIKEFPTTKRPTTIESQQTTSLPEAYDRQELHVRVISSFKSVPEEASKSIDSIETAETSDESSNDNYKSTLEKPLQQVKDDKLTQEQSEEAPSSIVSDEQEKSAYVPPSYSKYEEDYLPKKSQYESDTYKKKSKKFEETQEMTLFQPKWSWKSEQRL